MTAQLYSCGESKDYLKFCVHEGHVHVLLGLQENHIVEGDAKDAALDRQKTYGNNSESVPRSELSFEYSISRHILTEARFCR